MCISVQIPGTFQFPLIGTEVLKKPRESRVVMVGPGTGVAPFRAFIQECAVAGGANEPMILFFGCRNSQSKYLPASLVALRFILRSRAGIS